MNDRDTISRQVAISIPLTPKGLRTYQTLNLDDAYDEGWGDYQACVSQLPPAQPQRKTGKWVRCDTDEFRNMCKCSECGARIDIQEEFRSFFCYHCGADMRYKKEEDDNV